MQNILLISGLGILLYSSYVYPGEEPWELNEKNERVSLSMVKNRDILTESQRVKENEFVKYTDTFKVIASSLIRVYQIIISPQQGDVCSFSPSCSHYGLEAIKKYGFLQGTLMISDRLQRCNYCASGKYPLTPENRLYDPIENHSLW